jgi:hypothetical protein
MKEQEKFIRAVHDNNIQVVEHFLSSDLVFSENIYSSVIQDSCLSNNYTMTKTLLTCKYIDPSIARNYLLIESASRGYLSIVELLLKDKRVDPSERKNIIIMMADLKMHYDICDLLFKDSRVRNTLQATQPDIYYDLISKNTKNKLNEF